MKLLLLLLVLGCSACARLDITSEHDDSTEFSRYRSFAFGDPTEIGDERTTDEAMLRSYLEPVISNELIRKGLRRAGQNQLGDVAVYFWVNVNSATQRTWRSAYGPGGAYGKAFESQLQRNGTLVLDFVEPAKKLLVWRATIQAPLESTKEQNIELATEAVVRALEHYPPVKRR
ncbi:MAG: DUF4136 domain-containing protein [Nitrospira sp.]|nr:DUF4136 domain-containing protein [Nitrospira sp.]